MPTITEVKERIVTETPVVLFDCTLPGGAVERFSTHAVTFDSNGYAARVLGHNVFDMRWGADEGLDATTRLSLTLANADSYYSQIERVTGWRGTRVNARFVFFNLKTGAPETEAVFVYSGIMGSAEEITETQIRLSAHHRLQLSRYFLPDLRIQRRCPWTFPANATQRQEALDGADRGKHSGLFRCGYSADQAGGLGNLNSGSPFLACDYTRAACVERGMFDTDAGSSPTRRFGGIEFVPASVLVRGFGEAGMRDAAVADNQAKYNDTVPLHYGTVWVEPPVVFARNDGNLTRMEVLLGAGEIERVVKVAVNGIEIPEGTTGADLSPTGWYNLVSNGGVSGGFNLDFTDGAGAPLGDPYGSMAYMAVSVPNRVSDGRRLPQVSVLLEGLKLATFEESGAYLGEVFTNNPAWVMLDMLLRSGWTLAEVDVKSFARAATYCAEGIPATDLFGNVTTIPRFQCNLAVRRRRSLAEWIRGVRIASRLYLGFEESGLLELRVEGSLAVQQPVKPAGSNSVASLNGGWPAYEFGDGSNGFSGIARRSSGASSVRLWSRGAGDVANRVSIEFQDEFNEYQQDSLSLADVDDIAVLRQEVNANSAAVGVPNFHQAARALSLQIDKSVRGNTFIEFETSVRAAGLRPGDIITFTYLKEGLTRQPFRITRILPSVNLATSVIQGQLHDDAWYADDPASAAGTRGSRRSPIGSVGVPRPLVGTVAGPEGELVLGITEVAEEEADGGAVVILEAAFVPPVRPLAMGLDVPYLSLAAIVSTTGGSLAGGANYYYAVSAVNAAGEESALSFVVRAAVPAGTAANRVTLQQLRFGANAVGFHVYRGATPASLYRIVTSAPVASSFEDAGLAATAAGPADENFDHARFEWRLELHPTVTAESFSTNTIGSGTLQLIPQEHAGMTVRITGGKGRGQERRIVSHTANLLTIQGTWATPPDGTSLFVLVESSWHAGATGPSSPIRLSVPNRPGATVHITGLAVNALGRHSGYELAPLTRWQIGGSVGSLVDADVPPAPSFGMELPGQGMISLVGVSFATTVNTRTIAAGTWKLHYKNELAGATPVELAASIDAVATTFDLTDMTGVVAGALLQMEAEIVEVQDVTGPSVTVVRGAFGTTAVGHAAAVGVDVLERKVYVAPFARDFFGSPASGSYSFPVFLPNVRVAAAELLVTNSRGSSETTRVNVTGTVDRGLRTLSGGEATIQVDGALAIQTSAAPPLVIDTARAVGDVFAVVGEAPTGQPVVLQVRQNGDVYCTLTIPAGATVSNVVDGATLPPLQELSRLWLDVLSLGQTVFDSPGRDLTVTIRF